MSKRKPMLVLMRNWLRDLLVKTNLFVLRRLFGIHIGDDTIVSLRAKLDKTNPKGVYIGSGSYIAAEAMVLSHDYINKRHVNTHIGDNVFLGSRCIILPGVSVSDRVVVAAGAVVTKDIAESNVIVAGNPAKVVATNVSIGRHGQKVH